MQHRHQVRRRGLIVPAITLEEPPMDHCLCDRHSPHLKNHGGPCCGVGGGKCVACGPRRLTDLRAEGRSAS